MSRAATRACFLGFVLALAAACQRTDGLPGATPEAFAVWLAAHPNDFGFAAYSPGRPERGIFHHGDDLFPLASVRKVLVLGAYADAVSAGALDPAEAIPMADVERWYWPPTDDGAHLRALADLRRRGRIQMHDGKPWIALDDAAFAAIRWSDNAAADYLFERAGAERIDEFAKRHGLAREPRIGPIFGELVLWTTLDLSTWSGMSPDERAAESRRAASRWSGEPRLPFPGYARLGSYAESSFAGTAREWAALSAEIFRAPSDDRAAAIVRHHLEWPLAAYPEERAGFVHFAAKPGAVGGVRTEVVYIEPKDGPPVASALFLRRLRPADAASLGSSLADQRFLVRMATDAAFFDRVAGMLR